MTHNADNTPRPIEKESLAEELEQRLDRTCQGNMVNLTTTEVRAIIDALRNETLSTEAPNALATRTLAFVEAIADASNHAWNRATIEEARALATALRTPSQPVSYELLREALSAILLLVGDLRMLTSEEDRAGFTGLQRGIEAGKRIDAALSTKGEDNA